MAKERKLFKVLKDGLTIGYTVCMKGDLVVNAHLDNSVAVLMENGGEHEKHGLVIQEVPVDTQPEPGCRMIGNIYGGQKPVTMKQEAVDMGMAYVDGTPAEPKTKKKARR